MIHSSIHTPRCRLSDLRACPASSCDPRRSGGASAKQQARQTSKKKRKEPDEIAKSQANVPPGGTAGGAKGCRTRLRRLEVGVCMRCVVHKCTLHCPPMVPGTCGSWPSAAARRLATPYTARQRARQATLPLSLPLLLLRHAAPVHHASCIMHQARAHSASSSTAPAPAPAVLNPQCLRLLHHKSTSPNTRQALCMLPRHSCLHLVGPAPSGRPRVR